MYFGAVGIKKTRHAVPAGLLADAAAMIIAVWTVRLLFGCGGARASGTELHW